MVVYEEFYAWAAAVIRPTDWRVATAEDFAEAQRVHVHNAGHPETQWRLPLKITTRDGRSVVVEEHGIGPNDSTLCGLPGAQDYIYRHPFNGTGPNDCPTCAAKLVELFQARTGVRGADR